MAWFVSSCPLATFRDRREASARFGVPRADGTFGLLPTVYDSANHLPGEWNRLNRGVVKTRMGHVCLLSDLDAVRKALDLVEGQA